MRMFNKVAGAYVFEPLMTCEGIARAIPAMGERDAFDLLNTIHPVDRARVYRALGA